MTYWTKNVWRILFSSVLSVLILCQLRMVANLTMNVYREQLNMSFQQPSLPTQLLTANMTNDLFLGEPFVEEETKLRDHAFRSGMNRSAASSSSTRNTSSAPTNINDDAGIAVCLTFSDDNMILPEWLAYHYTTLPLRNLVLLLDSTSTTSPREILERWNQSHLVRSWIWTDEDIILNPYDLSKMKRFAHQNTPESLHRRLKTRQKKFTTACNQFFKRLSEQEEGGDSQKNSKDITWVGHFDVDEFVVPNRVGKWDHSARKKKQIAECRHLKDKRRYRDAIQLRHDLLDPLFQNKATQSSVTALEVLNNARQFYNFPNCITMARWNHGTTPLNHPVETWRSADGLINTSRLETIQYMRGDHPIRPDPKLRGKMILDVSQIPITNQTQAVSPHKPLPEPYCGSSEINFLESVLVLNHYKGSWERYNFRNDSRRTYEQWQSENESYRKGDSSHYEIHKWIPRFINQVGSEQQAAYLLGHSQLEEFETATN